jgi:hypothetical protein
MLLNIGPPPQIIEEFPSFGTVPDSMWSHLFALVLRYMRCGHPSASASSSLHQTQARTRTDASRLL